LPGPSGNVEYFLWLRRDESASYTADEVGELVRRAVEEGPQ
jgi:23S rRNA (cytidine1920-2'-O)/16S rRNA (cytidine1409-2'-O)-methyltransferase